MNYEVNLTGNVRQEATAGASALRDEADRARALAAGMREASREAAALRAARDALASGGDAVDVDAYRALSAEMDKASAKAAQLATELTKTGQAGRDFAGEDKAEKERTKAAEKAAKDREQADTKAEKERQQAADKSAREQEKADTKAKKGAEERAQLVKDQTKALLAYGAASAGIRGIGDLTQMAIGWRGVGQLQMVSLKATMDLRRAVSGVDAQPLVRGATALERNLSKSTVTGRALSEELTRGFNATFSVIERLEPVAEGVLQTLVLGGLEAEIAWQRGRAAAAPLVVLIEDATSRVDGMGASADAAVAIFEKMETVVEGVARAISFAAEKMDSLVKFSVRKVYDTPQFRADAEADRARDEQRKRAAAAEEAGPKEVYRFEGGKLVARDIVEGGVQTGQDIAAGIGKGIDAGIPAVRAAGARAGQAAVDGARGPAGADAHSPSRKTERLGGDMDEGAIRGMERDASGVAAAAAKALAPDVEPRPGQAGPAGGTTAGLSIGQIGPFHFGELTPQNMRQAAEEAVREGVRAALIRLGLPIPGGG
jgi:hypothetical protein